MKKQWKNDEEEETKENLLIKSLRILRKKSSSSFFLNLRYLISSSKPICRCMFNFIEYKLSVELRLFLQKF